MLRNGGTMATNAFKQLENEKTALEKRIEEMAKEMAASEKLKAEIERRNRELEENIKLVYEETEREKRKLEKDLKDSKEKVEKLQLELRTVKKRAKDLAEQLKNEQNANCGIARDKRMLEEELKGSIDQAAKYMTMEKKVKELEDQVKREQNAYGELERDKHMIEKELKEKQLETRGWVLIGRGAATVGECEEVCTTWR
ncbi:unnamed protein product, partial [Darwinula stevensoni]